MIRAGTLLALALTLLACASAPRAPTPTRPLRAADYVPLARGAAWSFDTETGHGVGTVLATLAVVRAEAPRFLVRSGTHTETWELREDGVLREGEYILRDPLRPGTSWTSRDGGRYEIRAVGLRREVTAGRFESVVEVVRSSATSGIATTTWYAPRVGVVEILATSTSSRGTRVQVRSTLRGYTLDGEL